MVRLFSFFFFPVVAITSSRLLAVSASDGFWMCFVNLSFGSNCFYHIAMIWCQKKLFECC